MIKIPDERPEVKKYFKNNVLSIPLIPQMYRVEGVQSQLEELTFKTFQEFENYVKSEHGLWKRHFPRSSFFMNYVKDIDKALTELSAVVNNRYHAEHHINAAREYIKNVPSTKSKLFEWLVAMRTKSPNYISGFLHFISSGGAAILTPDDFNIEFNYGFSRGKEYVESVKFSNLFSVDTATSNSDPTMDVYEKWFAEKEKQIIAIDKASKMNWDKLKADYMALMAEAKQAKQGLEAYKEKLRFAAPSEHWYDVSKKHRKSGIWWLVASGVIAIFTLAFLIIAVSFLISPVGENEHWFNIARHGAIIALIISLGFYALRTTVRIATSSMHLARDTAERAQLTAFFLSLTKDAGISSEERIIVINYLFSRSNTGLLKDEGHPEIQTIAESVKRAAGG